METIRIQTAQNVEIEYSVGGIGARIVAFIIDLFILLAYLIVDGYIIAKLDLDWEGSNIVYILLAQVPVVFYDLIMETLFNGQSFGKMIMKLKVVKLDGSRPGIGAYFLRWIMRPIDLYVSGGVVAIGSIFITGKGQRLGDVVADTAVITLQTKRSLADTVFSKVGRDYEPVFPEAAALRDEDVATLKELIRAGSKYEVPDKIVDAIYRAKELIQKRLDVETEMKPLDFFRTLIKDYNRIHGYAA